jgi:hypothetical protein
MQIGVPPRSQDATAAHQLGDAALREARGREVGVDVDVIRMEGAHLRSFARRSLA